MRKDDKKTISLSLDDDNVNEIENLDDKTWIVNQIQKWISKIKDSVPHRYYKYIHTLEPVKEESENNDNNDDKDNKDDNKKQQKQTTKQNESFTTRTVYITVTGLFWQMLEVLSNNNPENNSTFWFSINFMLLIAASYVSYMVHRYADDGAKFPSSSYIIYQIVATGIWCVEALTSSLYWMKQPNNYKVVVCIELLSAIYFLISFIFIGSKLSPQEKGSALPSTELDSFLYLLACTYNVYCAVHIPENDTTIQLSNDSGNKEEKNQLDETNKQSSIEPNHDDEEISCCKMDNYTNLPSDIELVSTKKNFD